MKLRYKYNVTKISFTKLRKLAPRNLKTNKLKYNIPMKFYQK